MQNTKGGKMITHVIFDLGDVVIIEKDKDWVAAAFAHVEKKFDFPENIFSSYFSSSKLLIDTGKMTFFDFYVTVLKKLDSDLDAQMLLDEHMLIFRKYLGDHDEEMLAFIRSLKSSYKVFYFTNTETETFADVCSRGVLDVFDGGFASTTLGFRKPDARSYELVLKKLSVAPENTVFIDNKKVNADGALAVGMHGLHYTGLEKLKKDLIELGVES